MLRIVLFLSNVCAMVIIATSELPSDDAILAFHSGNVTWASCSRAYVFPNITGTSGNIPVALKDMKAWYRESAQAKSNNCWSVKTPDDFCLASMRNVPKDFNQAQLVAWPCNQQDVQLWVLLARKYGLSLNVFGPGHEFLNRHVPRNISVAIRTGIMRSVEFDLNKNNRFNHAAGIMRVGSGAKWEDVHPRCQANNRICVSGHAPSVGVVGWMMGGGHGAIAPEFGMGVDNVAEVELVSADGSLVIANANGTRYQLPASSEWVSTTDADLFWAIRGGGGSSWGVVTHLTYFVHYLPSGFQSVSAVYAGARQTFADAIRGLAKWTTGLSKKWSYYIMVNGMAPAPCNDDDAAVMKAAGMTCGQLTEMLNLTGQDRCDISTLNKSACQSVPQCAENPSRTVLTLAGKLCRKTCDSCWDWSVAPVKAYYLGKKTDEEYTKAIAEFEAHVHGYKMERTETDYGQNYEAFVRSDDYEGIVPSYSNAYTIPQVNVASDMLNSDSYVSTLMDLAASAWEMNSTIVYSLFKTLPNGFVPHYSAPSALSYGFRNAVVWHSASIIHNPVAGPSPRYPPQSHHATRDIITTALYKLGNSSYFSESDYDMENWKLRYWGEEIATRLEAIKAKWDPELVFTCRHCIGDGMAPRCGDEQSLPPRNSCLPSVRGVTEGSYTSMFV